MDAIETASLIKSKEVSAHEIVSAAVERSKLLQPDLNFLSYEGYGSAIDVSRTIQPDHILSGVPFLIKDIDNVAGFPTRFGSRGWENAPPAPSQPANIQVYLDAGLVCLGKSATPEFGLLPTTEPLSNGATRNPWNREKSSGGSSGGAAAAVAAGVVPCAHASDGGGSIRIPASVCGVFGLKPSRSRMIETPPSGVPIQVSVHNCISRSVRDSALLFSLAENKSGIYPPIGMVTTASSKRLRIGVIYNSVGGIQPDEEVHNAITDVVSLLEDLGHSVRESKWPVANDHFMEDFLVLWSCGASNLVEKLENNPSTRDAANLLEPFTQSLSYAYRKLDCDRRDRAFQNLNLSIETYNQYFDSFDIILSPVVGKSSIDIGEFSPELPIDILKNRIFGSIGYTMLCNIADAPAMSVPLGWSQSGLPIGIQFAAKSGAEKTLFELAYELEEAAPWSSNYDRLHQRLYSR